MLKRIPQLSSLAIAVVAIACLAINFSFKNWEKQDRVIEWDVHSYYAYLPAYFIYDDIKLEKSNYRHGDYYMFWPSLTEDGRKIIKTSLGVSILYAPFFFVAHGFALISDYPEDGFSEPYKMFLLLSAIFYLVIGLDFLRKILIHYGFSDKIISLVILLIGLGTNLLCYASHSAPMTHVYSFCLFSIFIYFTIKWHQRQSVRNTILLGLVFGLISLVRPTNSVIILFFILYGISSIAELKQRLVVFFKNYLLLGIMAFCVLLVWTPQFAYWKTVTGHFLSYSYGDERFFFDRPRILEGLFSFRKGWLVYTPMMVFALIGIFFLKKEAGKLRLAIVAFMVVNVYIIFSWWCWWYGGTLGQRSLIESYALLAIPFASFLKFLWDRQIIYRILFFSVSAFFIWLNIFQTYQFEYHALHYDSMSKELYFKQFGSLAKIDDSNPLINWINYDEAKKGKLVETTYGIDSRIQQVFPAPKNETGRKTIQLKAYNGRYVCADQAANNIVIANRDSALGWETFTLILLEKNECAILASSNKFFCVELFKQEELTASRNNISKWETFILEQLDSNHVALKAFNEKYVGVDAETMQLFARSNSIGEREKFEMLVE